MNPAPVVQDKNSRTAVFQNLTINHGIILTGGLWKIPKL